MSNLYYLKFHFRKLSQYIIIFSKEGLIHPLKLNQYQKNKTLHSKHQSLYIQNDKSLNANDQNQQIKQTYHLHKHRIYLVQINEFY